MSEQPQTDTSVIWVYDDRGDPATLLPHDEYWWVLTPRPQIPPGKLAQRKWPYQPVWIFQAVFGVLLVAALALLVTSTVAWVGAGEPVWALLMLVLVFPAAVI